MSKAQKTRYPKQQRTIQKDHYRLHSHYASSCLVSDTVVPGLIGYLSYAFHLACRDFANMTLVQGPCLTLVA